MKTENNNPLSAGSTTGTPAACNFTTPAYCNLVQYARAYECGPNPGSFNNEAYYLQFTYQLSWDNAIYTKLTKGYLKIYDVATNALVVDEIIGHYNKIDVTDIGPDPINTGNNIYRVVFTCPTKISLPIVNGGTAYSVYTSALFSTTCSNGTNYLVGSAAVTSAGFTGASGNDPCKRNEKILCLLATNGTTYAASVSVNTVASSINTCIYNSTFIAPDVIEAQYSLNGGLSWLSNMTGYGNGGTGLIPYNAPTSTGFFMSGPTLPTGNYNLVFRYRNWKYTNPNWYANFPPLTPTPPSGGNGCVNGGNGTTGSGYTYYYYGNITIQ